MAPLALPILLADFVDSGVALNVESGNYWRLNARALALARTIVATNAAPPLFPEEVQPDLLAIRSQFEAAPRTGCRDALLSFRRDEGGYVMRWRGVPQLRLAADGSRVSRRESELSSAASALLWAVPHLLTLQGQAVLHAAAVRQEDGVRAFCGGSGAGKTTFAACVARHGATPVSEDLLLLDLSSEQPSVLLDAEPALRAWVTEAAAALERPGSEQEVTDLATLAGHRRAPLAEVVFLDIQRRTGDHLRRTPLPAAAAMESLLRNSFAELGCRDVWSHVFDLCYRLATRVPASNARVPDGVEKLEAAVAGYSWN
jgi:hypothetical protein